MNAIPSFSDYHGAIVAVERGDLMSYTGVKSEQLVAATKTLTLHASRGITLDADMLETLSFHIAALAFDLNALVDLIAIEDAQTTGAIKGGA